LSTARVTGAKRPNGNDLIFNVQTVLIYPDQAIFADSEWPSGEDMGYRVPLRLQDGVLFPVRFAASDDHVGLSEVSEISLGNNPLSTPAEMSVEIRFRSPRVFEILVDPDTLQTVILDVTSSAPQ